MGMTRYMKEEKKSEENHKKIQTPEKPKIVKLPKKKKVIPEHILKMLIVLIDPQIYAEENKNNLKELKFLGYSNIRLFNGINEGIINLKTIKFESLIIVLEPNIYNNFINLLKENIRDIYTIPKIIIYNKYNNTQICRSFYCFGEIKTFEELDNIFENKPTLDDRLIKSQILNEVQNALDIINNKEKLGLFRNNNAQLTFEYIDCLEKVELPLLYQSLIDITEVSDIENYNELLCSKYYDNNNNIKYLFSEIKSVSNIPIELLCKYYARIYTVESNFYKDINLDLRNNKKDNYLLFIKILYEGVMLKSLKMATNNELYRCSKISKDEINIIKKYLKKKLINLPGAIVFSKSFLSFSKEKNISLGFLNEGYYDNNLYQVLYILEKEENMDYSLSTHADIEDISYFANEKEVLFFPFSSFEIKDIKEKQFGNGILYEIKLLYLGKYLEKMKTDENIVIKNNIIPDTEFKKQIIDAGLINSENIKNTKDLFIKYKQYEYNINNKGVYIHPKPNNWNYIIAKIKINENNINKKIRIINTYEDDNNKDKKLLIFLLHESGFSVCEKNLKRRLDNYENKFKNHSFYDNESEIKDNIEIRINNKIIDFSYFYIFNNIGEHTIEYFFNKVLYKTNHLFCECEEIETIDLSHFYSKNVINTSCMFYGCKSLKYLNLSNFNTENATDMRNMFDSCSSLTSIDLSSFNTRNVTDMGFMFNGCISLQYLNLYNFDTKKVICMEKMFNDCVSLIDVNLSNFNVENVFQMRKMFCNCSSLEKLNLSNFYTYNILDTESMFYNCKSLTYLNLSNFYTTDLSSYHAYCMFRNCDNLNTNNIISKNKEIYDYYETRNSDLRFLSFKEIG